jgi:hypothetical protein
MPAMITRYNVGLLLMIGVVLASGCASGPPTVVDLTGTNGAGVDGYYIRHGRSVPFSGTLPMKITEPGLTQVTVRKLDPAAALSATATRPGAGMISVGSKAGKREGVRLDCGGGFSGETIPPEQVTMKRNNSIMVIAPYRLHGTWVFDDESAGLQQEPFVSGVPEIIDKLVKDIPNAEKGFRLTFSAKPFPGYQKKLKWVREEFGGNVYTTEDRPPMQGWLCPALFQYFKGAPKELYVRADAKNAS